MLFPAVEVFPECLHIPIVNDAVLEAAREGFQLLLQADTGFEDLLDIEFPRMDVFIEDDDRGQFWCSYMVRKTL